MSQHPSADQFKNWDDVDADRGVLSKVTQATITVTGTSGSLSRTAAISLDISPGVNDVQLITNSGCESGQNAVAPWSLSTGVICALSCGEAPHTGTWYAWFGGYGSTYTDTGYQAIAIPAGRKSASLAFYLHIDTAETTKTQKNETFTVQLVNSTGTGFVTLATFSNLDAASGGYTQYNFDLTPYIGQKGYVLFTGKENSSLQTSLSWMMWRSTYSSLHKPPSVASSATGGGFCLPSTKYLLRRLLPRRWCSIAL